LKDQLSAVVRKLKRVAVNQETGRVTHVTGNLIVSKGPSASIGDLCFLEPGNGKERIPVEVVGFRDSNLLLMPLGEVTSIDNGTIVVASSGEENVAVGSSLLGRVVDGLSRPIDGKGPLQNLSFAPLHSPPPSPMLRARINRPLPLGVKVIDGFALCGRGQRLGIFAAAGVGKSTLLGMMARGTEADVNVIALIGERGREVRDFIERDIGPEGMKRTVVVVSTSAEPPLLRIRAAFAATAIAGHFREQGKDVLLMMDSLTRVAMAQRDIGLAVGESSVRGYTPSVFTLLPRLLERSGTSDKGTVTGLYSVLVEGNDMDEPVSDAVRGMLDGHFVMSRAMAESGYFPAVDVSASLSRLMSEVATPEHQAMARRYRRLLSAYRDVEDLILTGNYSPGSDPLTDDAVRLKTQMRDFIVQPVDKIVPFEQTLTSLSKLVALKNLKHNKAKVL
jgi:flagellum-specific ATP synthase